MAEAADFDGDGWLDIVAIDEARGVAISFWWEGRHLFVSPDRRR